MCFRITRPGSSSLRGWTSLRSATTLAAQFMSEEESARAFVLLVRRDLAAFAHSTDALMVSRGADESDIKDMPHVRLEAGADITNQDIADGNEAEVAVVVEYMAAALRREDPLLCKALDCSYVEGLMWNIKDPSTREWAWGLFPLVIRQHYERTWGAVRF